ncbi:alpha/beta fold hydrolase [Rhodobacter maris]|uniref:Sigma-B regulation protein RsbQ n=1 Tax=Rhodobacter maris TaxID=446682 RepID=A0A285ST62_9RHOB|nr:alpha/beta hydrolase [Rhodobacter maris]SOC11565.1 sigma-B regulation protein RsbQ [Rhodobacter maris]
MLDDGRHNLCQIGAGEVPLMLAHGYGCDQSVWRAVAPLLAPHYRVVLFDHAGCGQAAGDLYDRRRHATLRGYVEDLLALLDRLRLGPVRFVGHSVSSMIGALAAIERPDLFAALVMIGPSARYIDTEGYTGGFSRDTVEDLLDLLDSNFADWVKGFAPIATGNPDRPELASDFAQRLRRNDPEIASAFARATFFVDARAALPKLQVPTLILQSQDDPIAPDPAVEFVHRAIPGSRLMRLESHGHCPHLSHPDIVAEAILAGLAPAPEGVEPGGTKTGGADR